MNIKTIALAAVIASVTAQVPLPAKAANKEGWWIKVRTDKTEANSISFQIGTREKNRRDWRTWSSGQETEFDVPADFKNIRRIYIHATANPGGRNAWFCMMYKDAGVKHMDFDDDEDQEKQQSDRDDECK